MELQVPRGHIISNEMLIFEIWYVQPLRLVNGCLKIVGFALDLIWNSFVLALHSVFFFNSVS